MNANRKRGWTPSKSLLTSAPTSLLAVFLLVLSLGRSANGSDTDPAPFRLANGHLQIEVARPGRLVEVLDQQSKHNFVAAAAGEGGLWQVEVLAGGKPLSPAQAGSFRCQPLVGGSPALHFIWENFHLSTAPALRVQVTVTLNEAEAVSRWGIEVDGLNRLELDKIRFPRLPNLSPQTNEVLAVPVWLGQQTAQARKIFSDPAGKGRRQEWTHPGLQIR